MKANGIINTDYIVIPQVRQNSISLARYTVPYVKETRQKAFFSCREVYVIETKTLKVAMSFKVLKDRMISYTDYGSIPKKNH